MSSAAAPLEARPARVRPARFLLPVYTWLVIAYTIVPIGVMVAYGFNKAPSGRLTFNWLGFTTEWYRHVFDIPDLTSALVTRSSSRRGRR